MESYRTQTARIPEEGCREWITFSERKGFGKSKPDSGYNPRTRFATGFQELWRKTKDSQASPAYADIGCSGTDSKSTQNCLTFSKLLAGMLPRA